MFYCCWNYNRSAQFVCPNHNIESSCDGDSTPSGASLNPRTLTSLFLTPKFGSTNCPIHPNHHFIASLTHTTYIKLYRNLQHISTPQIITQGWTSNWGTSVTDGAMYVTSGNCLSRGLVYCLILTLLSAPHKVVHQLLNLTLTLTL